MRGKWKKEKLGKCTESEKGDGEFFAIIVNGWSRQTSALVIEGLQCRLTIKNTARLPYGEERRMERKCEN